MEEQREPGYGQTVSPDEADVSAMSGEPEVRSMETGNRDDAGSREREDGGIAGSPEEQARSLLEGCEGMEPPYEYMSVDGSPDRTEHELTANQSIHEGGGHRYAPADRDVLPKPRPDGPMLNGVGSTTTARSEDHAERSTGSAGGANFKDDWGRSSQSENFEDLIRQLLQQNHALQNELAWARQASGRTSGSESEVVGLYRGQSSDRRVSGESVEVREGRGSRHESSWEG